MVIYSCEIIPSTLYRGFAAADQLFYHLGVVLHFKLVKYRRKVFLDRNLA